MPYIANQYNYATPLHSVTDFTSVKTVADVKYFTLSDNKLDGTYFPIVGSVGLWGSSLSDTDGLLLQPFVITITEDATLSNILIMGSSDSYPVDFTVTFYNGSGIVHTIEETGNTSRVYTKNFDSDITVTEYVITITRVSSAGVVARVYNVHEPSYVASSDYLGLHMDERKHRIIQVVTLSRSDAIKLNATDTSHVHKTIPTADNAVVDLTHASTLTNIHSVMKQPSRRIYGKVSITYTDPLLSSVTRVAEGSQAYNSRPEQLFDGVTVSSGKLFTLYENNLTGVYPVGGADSQVGWVSNKLSGAEGYFSEPVILTINVEPRPVLNPVVIFDDSYGAVAEDFTVDFTDANGASKRVTFTGNTDAYINIPGSFPNTVTIVISVTKLSKEGLPVAVLDVPIISTILYKGYENESNLVSIDMLEELTYSDDVEALGGISANEVTIVLDNSDMAFNFNNAKSVVAAQMKRNRKIEPWLGAEIIPGTIEWYRLGVYWSYKWDVPVDSLIARVVGFDTLGLLDTTDFTNHHTQVNKSIGELIAYVLDDARNIFEFLQYTIDAALYDIVIPYAWFDASSHTAALRKISSCYPVHVYCDRNGTVCAAPQRLRLDSFVDTWSDSTNVIRKNYDTLYTTMPNVINVTVSNVRSVDYTKLAEEELTFNIVNFPTKTLNFSAPFVDNLSISIDRDDTVEYTYDVYSWGIIIKFSGYGNVRKITCQGSAVTVLGTATVSQRDNSSIQLNGVVTRDISSDFIQTADHASLLINRLFSLSEYDKYDAAVDYRGDIAISINDPILLHDGIAPDNRYNIKRHQLFWNGALTGSADLNT